MSYRTIVGPGKILIATVLMLFLSGWHHPVKAHETDQFTVPNQPLADIGPEVTQEVIRRIQKIMDELNTDMNANPVRSADDARLNPETLAKRLQISFGTNPFQTEFEGWILKNRFEAQPAHFYVKYNDSVFSGCAVARPLMALALSPTININGVYLGLDKMGHFVQQGHQYYERYMNVINKDDALRIDALQAAIRHGISQENGIYGSFTIGVYSNADMAANYAGMHFYLNLTQPVSLGGRIYEPILEIHEGRWRFKDGQPAPDLFTRFITNHLNEAMNPPVLTGDIRGIYEKNVRKLSSRWVMFYESSARQEEQRLGTLSRWFGEPYGYAGPENIISIASVHVDEETPQTAAVSPAEPEPVSTSVVSVNHSPGM